MEDVVISADGSATKLTIKSGQPKGLLFVFQEKGEAGVGVPLRRGTSVFEEAYFDGKHVAHSEFPKGLPSMDLCFTILPDGGDGRYLMKGFYLFDNEANVPVFGRYEVSISMSDVEKLITLVKELPRLILPS